VKSIEKWVSVQVDGANRVNWVISQKVGDFLKEIKSSETW
jgi:hypothetical protein